MTIHFLDGKTKCLPLIRKWLQVLHIPRRAVGLILVVVDDNCQIAQFMFTGTQRRFPNRSFVALPITDDHKNPMVGLFMLGTYGKTNPDGQSMSQTSGGSLHPRNLDLRVPA